MKLEKHTPGEAWFALAVFILLVIGLILPVFSKAKRRGGMHCVNQVKQIAIGIGIYANENEGLLPWEISTWNGGFKEMAATRDVYRLYLVMSNELSSTRILTCPQDNERDINRAKSFNHEKPLNSNSQVSYLLNVTSSKKNPTTILVGDRNLLIDGRQYSNGRYFVHTQEVVRWGPDIHKNKGNVALMDGSVMQTSNEQIQKILQASGQPLIGLAIP